MRLSTKQISLVMASALLSVAIFVAQAAGDLEVAPPQPQPNVEVAAPQPQPELQVAAPQPQPDLSVQPPEPTQDLQPAAPAEVVQPAAPAEVVQPAAPAEVVQPAAPAEVVQPAAPADVAQPVDVGGPASQTGSTPTGQGWKAVVETLNDGRSPTKRAFRVRSSRVGRAFGSAPSHATRSEASRRSKSASYQAKVARRLARGSSLLGAKLDYDGEREQGYSRADSAG